MTLCYLHKPADRPAEDDGVPLAGRRMTVTLTFEIQPSLSVASMCFLDHFAPLLNGQRLALDRPLDPRVPASVRMGATSSLGDGVEGGSPGCGGGGGGDDDSDSAADVFGSRSTSMVIPEFSTGG